MVVPSVALPGQLLGSAEKYLPGPGTHIHESQIYASIAGPVSTTPTPKTTTTPPPPLLSIQRAPPSTDPGILGPGAGGTGTLLPCVNSTVLATITRLTPRFATCEILVIDNTVCRASFTGQIRREDVRATEKDRVRMDEAFRVGDLVRGTVVSLGDQSSYYVSTSENGFGVVMARSEEGRLMYPVSWREFRDPVSGRAELRKAAKPF